MVLLDFSRPSYCITYEVLPIARFAGLTPTSSTLPSLKLAVTVMVVAWTASGTPTVLGITRHHRTSSLRRVELMACIAGDDLR